MTFDGQVELHAFGTPDPVALHDLDPFGPLQVVERVEELVGIRRDAEEPLLEVAFVDEVARTLAGAVGSTCSFASTVWQPGHQFTGAVAR